MFRRDYSEPTKFFDSKGEFQICIHDTDTILNMKATCLTVKADNFVKVSRKEKKINRRTTVRGFPFEKEKTIARG